MNKLFNNILLSATLLIINGSNNVYSVEQYEELGLNDFTYDYLSVNKNYSIDENGALFRTVTKNSKTNTIYPTYEGQKLYDLQTRINNIANHGGVEQVNGYNVLEEKYRTSYYNTQDLAHPGGVETFNLIVFKCNGDLSKKTYTLIAPESLGITAGDYLEIQIKDNNTLVNNSNLVIPYGTTLDFDNIQLNYNSCYVNTNIIILGTITNTSKTYNSYCIDMDSSKKSKVILGPQALYHVNNTPYCNGIIPLFEALNSFLLYPGCEIKPSDGTPIKYILGCSEGYIQLNRYVTMENTNKLNGVITDSFHIIYPTTIANSKGDDLKDEYQIQKSQIKNNWYITPYFPNLYLKEKYYYDKSIEYPYCYHFEEPDLPLLFNYNKELNKNILGINKYNELAKYDVKLWNECKINGRYGIEKYNKKLASKGNYFNVDEAYKLFYGVTKDQEEFELKTNKIYIGLIGSYDKEIKLDLTNIKNKNEVYLYGDNRGFEGTLIIPKTITDVFLNKNSIIKSISYNEKKYTIVIEKDNKIHYYEVDGWWDYKTIKPEDIGLTFHYIDKDSNK